MGTNFGWSSGFGSYLGLSLDSSSGSSLGSGSIQPYSPLTPLICAYCKEIIEECDELSAILGAKENVYVLMLTPIPNRFNFYFFGGV